MGSGDQFQPKPGDLLADRFRVERLIGSGGMGAVYEVLHVHTKHRRALKLLHPAAAKRREVVDRFLREASVAGRIGHPNIVEIVDAGWLPEGPPYVLMELLAGEDLAEVLERGRLPLQDAAAVVHKVASAVAAAHKVGIIHRDIKPANVFLVAGEAGARVAERDVKLLDFGISKFAAEHTALLASTKDGGPLGTPLYMAPEQLEDSSRVDERSDVFALGLLLYEALAGNAPYKAESLGALFKAILGGERVPLGEVVSGLPEDVVELVEHALALRREDRVRDASVFAIELSRWVPPSAAAPRSARAVQAHPSEPKPVAAAASDVPERPGPSPSHEQGAAGAAPSVAASTPAAFAPSAVPAAPSPAGTASIHAAPTAPPSRTWVFAVAAVVVAAAAVWAVAFRSGATAGSGSAEANVASPPSDAVQSAPVREIRVEPTTAESAPPGSARVAAAPSPSSSAAPLFGSASASAMRSAPPPPRSAAAPRGTSGVATNLDEGDP